MTNIQAFILGLVQGLAEFLPISSSGHLAVLQSWFGIEEAPLLLDTLLHMGTLLAVLIVYWKRIWKMICHPIRSELKLLVLATLPTVAVTLLFKDWVDKVFTGDYVGFCFIGTAFLLLLGELVNRFRPKTHKPVRWYDALIMGIFQSIAIAPGLSRSGSTITGGLISGVSRKRAANFSFLMSIPACCGSAVLGIKDIWDLAEASGTGFMAEAEELFTQLGAMPVVIGIVTAAVTGLVAIKLMLKIVRGRGLSVFAAYTFVLGLVMVAIQVLGKVF